SITFGYGILLSSIRMTYATKPYETKPFTREKECESCENQMARQADYKIYTSPQRANQYTSAFRGGGRHNSPERRLVRDSLRSPTVGTPKSVHGDPCAADACVLRSV